MDVKRRVVHQNCRWWEFCAACGSSKWARFMRLPTSGNDDEDRLDGIWKRLGIVGRTGFDHSFVGSVLVEANMSAVLVVVSKILASKPSQMKFIQRNDLIE